MSLVLYRRHILTADLITANMDITYTERMVPTSSTIILPCSGPPNQDRTSYVAYLCHHANTIAASARAQYVQSINDLLYNHIFIIGDDGQRRAHLDTMYIEPAGIKGR